MKKLLSLCAALALVLLMGQAALAADGAALYKRGCAGCHGKNAERGTGGSAAIKGKSSAELLKMLRGYVDGTYGGKQKATMQNAVKRFSADELKATADYVGGLK